MHYYYLKIDDNALFKNRSKRPAVVISPIKSMLNFEVEILSPQKLDYKMDCTEYPVEYNCLEIEYCGHRKSPFGNIQFKQFTI